MDFQQCIILFLIEEFDFYFLNVDRLVGLMNDKLTVLQILMARTSLQTITLVG